MAPTNSKVKKQAATTSKKGGGAGQTKPAGLSTLGKRQVGGGDGEDEWPFPVDYLDHFETCKQALLDLEPVLYRLAHHLGKPKAELVVYDPFFCKGSIREHYKEIGITNFIHEKRDFYADVTQGKVPDYDILVTNPPYSGDHKERILNFCVDSGKPWALLWPSYVANKQYYADLTACPATAAGTSGMPPFFLVPDVKYDYEHPERTGHDASPFFSIWTLHLGSDTARIFSWCEKQKPKPGKPALKALRSVADLQEGGVAPNVKRPNPKQRKKLKAQKEEQS